jgi:hypothetical protein
MSANMLPQSGGGAFMSAIKLPQFGGGACMSSNKLPQFGGGACMSAIKLPQFGGGACMSAIKLPQFGAGACVSKACKNVKSAVNGYEEFTLDGKKYRIYGDMKGMTPREYIDSWGKPLTNGHFRRSRSASAKKHSASPPKHSAPTQKLRRSARIAERKRRNSMGGSRKNNKTRKQRK